MQSSFRFWRNALVCTALVASGTLTHLAIAEDAKPSSATETKDTKKQKATALFNGKDLTNWKITDFGGQGEVPVKNGQLILEFGNDLTGITYTGKVPTVDYELNLEAMRIDGSDFFCGLTFPVGKGHCSLILGGWGGGVVGLSSIDKMDASENQTTQFMTFDQKKWYPVKVRVTEKAVEAWVSGKQIIEVERKGKTFTTRIEMELSKPLGVASFQTTAAIRNFTLTRLGEKKVSEAKGTDVKFPKAQDDTFKP